ncbi:MAG: hypothetical protein SO096_07055 [Prevotella sp.]|nr:hypothetical protein [Prevotella sp.]
MEQLPHNCVTAVTQEGRAVADPNPTDTTHASGGTPLASKR